MQGFRTFEISGIIFKIFEIYANFALRYKLYIISLAQILKARRFSRIFEMLATRHCSKDLCFFFFERYMKFMQNHKINIQKFVHSNKSAFSDQYANWIF